MDTATFPCLFCEKPVKSHQQAIDCDSCDRWQHRGCGNTGMYSFLICVLYNMFHIAWIISWFRLLHNHVHVDDRNSLSKTLQSQTKYANCNYFFPQQNQYKYISFFEICISMYNPGSLII